MKIRQRYHLIATLTTLVAAMLPSSVAQSSLTDEEYDKCVEAIKNADVSGNSRLNKDPEYVLFLQEITGDEFVLTTYDNLPEAMQMNYEIYESEGVVDVRGATRGGDATKRQKRVAETFCETTNLAINAVPEDDPSRASYFRASNFSIPSTNLTSSNSTYDSDIMANTTNPMGSTSLNVSSVAPSTMQPNSTSEAVPATTAPEATGSATRNTTAPDPTSAPSANASQTMVPVTGNATTDGTGATQTPQDSSTAPPSSAATTLQPAVSNATSSPSSSSTPSSPPINETITTSPATIVPTATSPASPAPTTAAPVALSNTTTTPGVVPTMVRPGAPTAAPVVASNTTDQDGSTGTNPPSAVYDPFADCKMVLKFSDLDGDSSMNKLEYVWFLNDNWNSPYPGVAFKDLPQELKDNFFYYASGGKIDFSTTASELEVSDEHEQFLDMFCNDTQVAVGDEPETEAAGEEATMATFKKCLETAILFDANNDSFVDQAEYVALIHELSHGNFGKSKFENMPQGLQNNFMSLTDNLSIDLGGALQGQILQSSQQEILEALCVDTSYALHEASQGPNEQGGNDFDAVDTDTMLEYAVCFMQMADHDLNNDSRLDAYEYVGLVNQMGKGRFQDYNFTNLPLTLRENFGKLETDGSINIQGSHADQTPDTEQQHFLGKICIETTAAVNMELEFENPNQGTSNPTSETDAEYPDGVEMGEPIVIHSSFNIYSDVLIPDHEFLMGATREVLQEAYKQFVMEVVDGLSQSNQRGLLRRILQEENEFLAILDRDSPTVYQIVHLSCAGASQDAMCKTVFAQYEITPIESMDRTALYDEYVRVTQQFIDSGLLQSVLERVDPETSIAVIGASEPVIFEEPTPTAAPVPYYNDDQYMQEKANNKKKNIALIAIAVGCLLLASLIGLVMVRIRKRRAAAAGDASGDNGTATDQGSLEKASDTASKDDFHQEGSENNDSQGSSDSTALFRNRRNSCRNSADSDDDVTDAELGTMQVVDLCEGVNAAANDFEAIGNKHLKLLAKQEEAGIPPLRKKRDDDDDQSEDISFAFRRYAIDGDQNKSEI